MKALYICIYRNKINLYSEEALDCKKFIFMPVYLILKSIILLGMWLKNEISHSIRLHNRDLLIWDVSDNFLKLFAIRASILL